MTTLQRGEKAPYFEAIDQNGKIIKLTDYKGKKIILFFYPKDNTPTCTIEVCNLRDNYSLLQDAGFELLGVSADTEVRHQNFIKKHHLPFSLLADTEKKMIRDYKVFGEKMMFGKIKEGIFRTTFVINEKGILELVLNKVKSKEHATQILQELEAIAAK